MTMRSRFLIAAAAALPALVCAQTLTGSTAAPADTVTEELLEETTDNSPIIDLTAPPRGEISLRSRIGGALQTAAGYLDATYAGSPLRSYERLTAGSRGVFSAGMLVEKDAGEKSFADFSTGFLFFPQIAGRGRVVLGDFSLEEGEGIAWWRGASYGKGADVITPAARHARGIVPHRSSGENSFLRGAGGEVDAGPVTAGFIWSEKREAATLDADGNATGLPSDGLFRSAAEIAKRDDLTERVIGISFRAGAAAGLSWHRSTFSRRLILDGGRRFDGRSYSTLAAHYALGDDDARFFGEWGVSNNALGGTSGMLLRPSGAFSFVLSVRRYPEEFTALHGLPFGDRGSNESGAYAGIRLAFGGGFALAAFADRFHDLSAPPGRLPAGGGELLAEPSFARGALKAAIRYRARGTGERMTTGEGLLRPVTGRSLRESLRLNVRFGSADGADLEGTVDRTAVRHEITGQTAKGFLFSDRVSVRPSPGLSLDLQLALFNTDAYESGIAVVERDVPGVVALPLLYGRGVRWSATAAWEAGVGLRLSAKYSETIRDDVVHIGSGPDELPSNRDNRLTIQLDGAW